MGKVRTIGARTAMPTERVVKVEAKKSFCWSGGRSRTRVVDGGWGGGGLSGGGEEYRRHVRR